MPTHSLLIGALLGLLVLCQTLAAADWVKMLVFDTDSSEELTRDAMNEQLNRADPKQVARVLSQVKDKSSTMVTGGLTVDRLLAQNAISTSQCSRQSMRLRVAVCERTKNFTKVNLYCRMCLVEMAKLCIERMDTLTTDQSERRWLLGLTPIVRVAPLQFGTLRNQLERYIVDEIQE